MWKASGLTQAQLAQQPLPSSSLTIGGLVKHMALVEDSWFTDDFAGLGEPEPWASVDWDADRDWEFHTAADDTPGAAVRAVRGVVRAEPGGLRGGGVARPALGGHEPRLE